MSVGKPIIVNMSVGCSYDLIKHVVNGYILPDGDVELMCKSIKKIFYNDKIRISMGKSSSHIIKQYNYCTSFFFTTLFLFINKDYIIEKFYQISFLRL